MLQEEHKPRSGCSLIRVYTVCHSVCTDWMHYTMEKPPRSNFRVITVNISVVWIFMISVVLSNIKVINLNIIWFYYKRAHITYRCIFEDSYVGIELSYIMEESGGNHRPLKGKLYLSYNCHELNLGCSYCNQWVFFLLTMQVSQSHLRAKMYFVICNIDIEYINRNLTKWNKMSFFKSRYLSFSEEPSIVPGL